MGTDYHQLLEQALAYRSSADPDRRLRAIEALRDEIPGATPVGSTSVEAALAKIRARARPSP
jgi:hypothetical protein